MPKLSCTRKYHISKILLQDVNLIFSHLNRKQN